MYQDDPNNSQAVLTAQNVFYTNVSVAAPTNRALIRYTNGDDIWYERIFSRLDKSFQGFGGSQTLTGLLDASGTFATGYQNLSGVIVKDQNGTMLTLGVEYTIDLATGTITAIGNAISGSITVSFSTASSIVMAEIGARILPDKITVAATLDVTSQTFATGYTDISEVIVTDPATGLPAVEGTDYTLDAVNGKIVWKASGSLGTAVSISLRPYYVGYVRQARGTAFNADTYVDPFAAGFDVAARGAIIGVNNLPGNDLLEVWWFTKSKPPGSKLTGTYWPSSVQTYQLRWPLNPPQIVLASDAGSGPLSSLQAAGKIYTQNDSTKAGFNPNEEHALLLNGTAWALRDDLNLATTSQPYVLVAYTGADQRPAMTVFKVLREDATYKFNYPGLAGVVLQAPMPLPLLPPPFKPDGSLASYEYQPGAGDPPTGTFAPAALDANFAHYQKFTWADRTGTVWLYRGPHAGNGAARTFDMRFFYRTQAGFFFPSKPAQAVGTVTPYLRNLDATSSDGYQGDPVTGAVSGEAVPHPLDVVFTPQWPASLPELRVSQTLTTATLGLPAVRGQTSAELIYQQSIALDNSGKPNLASRQQSARLYDPTVAKKLPFAAPGAPLVISSIPESVNTSVYQGKTYFPGLPPHLSLRLFFDPAEGAYGSLVFQGKFVNVGTGEPYLLLNVMSAAEVLAAKSLCTETGTVKALWDGAIDALSVTMNTYIENPGKLGTYIVDTNETATPRYFYDLSGNKVTIPPGLSPQVTPHLVGVTELAEISYGDTARDSYAVAASGGGEGYVVLATGNGRAFTPAGEPVSLQVFKVSPPLQRGEVKVINSANPLDEKLTLQHSGDFAGHPEDYDFEWRYAPPVNGMAPVLYSLSPHISSAPKRRADAGGGARN